MNTLRIQTLAKYYERNTEILDKKNNLEKYLNDVAKKADATFVSESFHSFNTNIKRKRDQVKFVRTESEHKPDAAVGEEQNT